MGISNKDKPLVSIILPTYNGEQYIAETLKSVINQSYSNFEVLVINDGSTDNTLSLLENIDPRIKVISKKNGGIANARNKGLANVSGQYVAFLDHDDIWHPKKLALQVDYLLNNDDIAVVYSDFTRWEGGEANAFYDKAIEYSINDKYSGWIYQELVMTNHVLFSTALFRKAVFDDVGVFNETLKIADDWDMAIRISRKYQFLQIVPSLVLYRVHPLQTSRKVVAEDYESNCRQSIIDRYGLVGPDGTRVDEIELNRRFFRSLFCHAYMNFRGGDPGIAARYFVKSLYRKPYDSKSWFFLLCCLPLIGKRYLLRFFR